MAPELTIITVSYNSADAISQCQANLIRSHNGPYLIVDNASPDKSAERLEREFPTARILEQQQNRGYGSAANTGLRLTTTPYALLINPDIIVNTQETCVLLNLARQDPDETVIWAPATEKSNFDPGASMRPADCVSGCAMLFHMDRLRSLGFFDENIFLYYEETDLCLRAAKHGLAIKLCPQVFFDHLGNQSSSSNHSTELRKSWHFGWSHAYFHQKHTPRTAFFRTASYWMRYKRKAMFSRNQVDRELYEARASGVAAAFKGLSSNSH